MPPLPLCVILFIAGFVMTACASSDRLDTSGQGPIVDMAMTGPGDQEAQGREPAAEEAAAGEEPAEPPGEVRWVGRGEAETAEFAARDADGATQSGRRLVLEHVDPPGDGRAGEWIIRRRLVGAGGGEGKVIRVQHVARLDDGSIVLKREENMTEDVDVDFEPAMVVVPARLRDGDEPRVQPFTMTVHPLGQPDQIKAKGQATNTIRVHAGEGAAVRLADGRVRPAWQVVAELRADLGPASVRNVTVQWFGPLGDDHEPDAVLLAERREETTRVLGIQTRHSVERWVRVEEEKSE